MTSYLRRKRVPIRDTQSCGPPKRWRFRPASGALILTLLAGNAVPSMAATDNSSVAVRNGGTSVLFDSSAIQSPDGELVFNEIDLGGCVVEGRDGTTYRDPACVEGVLAGRMTRGWLSDNIFKPIGNVISGAVNFVGGVVNTVVGGAVCILTFFQKCGPDVVYVQQPAPPINHPPTVSLVTPGVGNVFQKHEQVNLKWTGSDPEGNYPLKYSVFFGTDLLADNLSSGEYPISADDLEFGKSYFWMVEAKDSLGNAQKGPPWGFSIRGNHEPTLKNLLPDNKKEFEKVENVTLEWEGNDPEGDEIIYTVFLGTEILAHCENILAQTCSIPEGKLGFGKSYFWVVEATDIHGNTQKGEPWAFSIRDNHKPTVNNDSPEVGDIFSEPTDVILEWEGSDIDGDDITYSVFFGTKLFAPCENTTANTCIIPQSEFDFGKKYFWQVEAKDSYGNVQKGAPWDFSIRGNFEPTLKNLLPDNEKEFEKVENVTLEWEGNDQEGDEIRYTVFLGTELLAYCENILAQTCPIPKSKLEFGKSYFWVVEATDIHGNTQKGEPWAFSIRDNQKPTVNNSLPMGGNTFSEPTDVALEWEGSDIDGDDITYSVFFGTELFAPCENTTANTCIIPKDEFDFDKSYFWQVEAKDEYGNIQKGVPWGFSVGSNHEPTLKTHVSGFKF